MDEKPISECKVDVDGRLAVTVQKMSDDPICARISLGGNVDIGLYLVYRGDEQTIEDILRVSLEAFKIKRSFD